MPRINIDIYTDEDSEAETTLSIEHPKGSTVSVAHAAITWLSRMIGGMPMGDDADGLLDKIRIMQTSLTASDAVIAAARRYLANNAKNDSNSSGYLALRDAIEACGGRGNDQQV